MYQFVWMRISLIHLIFISVVFTAEKVFFVRRYILVEDRQMGFIYFLIYLRICFVYILQWKSRQVLAGVSKTFVFILIVKIDCAYE